MRPGADGAQGQAGSDRPACRARPCSPREVRVIRKRFRVVTVLIAFLASPGLAQEPPPAPSGSGGSGRVGGSEEHRSSGRQLHRFELQEGVDVVGREQKARAAAEETLLDLGYRYAIGYEQIRMANPEVDTWLPGQGTLVDIPSRYILPDAPREGLVINLAEMRLYRYPEDAQVVEVFPVSVGRRDWSTPLGRTEITEKIEDPAWYPPDSIRAEAEASGDPLPRKVPPGPDNPLGRYALQLELSGYLLHGTNRPWGIGMRATHGCIRLHPHDVAYLFEAVSVGTPVRIVNQPFKAGWSKEGELYMQAYPFFGGGEQPSRSERLAMAVERVARALGSRNHRVAGERVRSLVDDPSGEVVKVSRPGAADMSSRQGMTAP